LSGDGFSCAFSSKDTYLILAEPSGHIVCQTSGVPDDAKLAAFRAGVGWIAARGAAIIVGGAAKTGSYPAGEKMKIFIAGASGAIGQPLVAELIQQGHTVTGMTHSDAGAQKLQTAGAAVARVSVFDEAALAEALRRSSAEVVIDELTALPKDPSELAAAGPGDRKLRLEGGGNLFRAA
jgi:hypothetical protein